MKYIIEIDTVWASDVAIHELDLEIEEFLLSLTWFSYHTKSENRIIGDKNYYSKSVNK